MQWVDKKIPELGKHAQISDNWINSRPLTLTELRGKIVLVDFWEYSCINCLRTLPYLKAWYERYHQFGFEIIGVHVPEFEFVKQKANVEKAVKDLKIAWPIVLDNDYETWHRYENNVWPRELLVDTAGTVVHDQSGEGNYGETEATIQKLIRRMHPDAKLPPLLAEVRAIDKPGAVCFRTSPEIYLGFERGQKDQPYLAGEWESQRQHLRSAAAASPEQFLLLRYQAAKVFAVVRPEAERGFKVLVEQDGQPLPKEVWGEDIQEQDGKTFFVVAEARMYRLINNPQFGEHRLKLLPQSTSFW